MKAKAAVTYEPHGPFIIEEIEVSEPKNNEVLVRVTASGVCHTDAAVRNQEMPVPLPAVLGHEGSGIVEKVGEGVSSVKAGDHVVLSYASCGKCENCLSGHPAYCERMMELNFGGVMLDRTKRLKNSKGEELGTFFGQSSFAMYAVAHERNIVKVDDSVDIDLLGPLGCGIQTGSGTVLNKLKPSFGQSIAVYGCGAVGLSAVMGAKIVGAYPIIAIDVVDSRLKLAKELGATHTINGKESNDVVAEVRKITNGGSHYAVDTAGVPMVTRQAVHAIRAMGTSVVIGATPETTFNVSEDILLGKALVGVIEGEAIPQVFIPKLIEYYKDGKFPFDKLVKFYEFDEIEQAFEDSKNGLTIKPILKMPR